MLWRKYENQINDWIVNGKKALLITGARQIGKTFLIREMCKKSGYHFVEFNLINQPEIVTIFEQSSNANEILVRLRVASNSVMEKGKTIIFLDEIQEYKEAVTKIKFLVEEGSYKYIMSGSLLGVELANIKSFPIGYMQMLKMYPMDFQEFLVGLGVHEETLKLLEKAYEEWKSVDEFIHGKIIELFYLYLIVGGMPDAVMTYIRTNNIQKVTVIQKEIVALYKEDFTKYEKEYSLKLKEIYDVIPSELNKQNKRFVLSVLNKEIKFNRYENNFLWLKDAGVALPIYNVDEPRVPLLQSKNSNLFKLFMSDVGLLTSHFSNDIKLKILNNDVSVNNGALFENAVAQQLVANELTPYYFKNGKLGELDFMVEINGECVPLEIKSGKDYKRHCALNRVLEVENYQIKRGFVFSDNNVKVEDKVVYLPIYMIMFLKEKELENPIVSYDLSGL